MKRRDILAMIAGGTLGSGRLATASPAAPAPQRVVVIGGAWAGLSAARALRQAAPQLDVLVLDRDPVMRSLPLSNPWLVGRTPERLAPLGRAALAQRLGYRFVAAEVLRLDRVQRQVHTSQGAFDYDWLVLSSGIAYDYAAWFGDDTNAARAAQDLYPAGFVATELDALKQRLSTFTGGDLVMTVPPPPYRCPPAPYERAMMIAWWLKTQRIKGKLTLIDGGGGLPRFTRLFAERYPDQIDFQPYSNIRSVDPFGRRIVTDEGELRFDHAILLPPMRASALVAQAGLLGQTAQATPTRWAGVDPLRLCSPLDERIYLAGDVLDTVSPLFGYYPKTAHVATRLGAAVALQIAARSRGEAPAPAALPDSVCHVWLDADPAEQLRIEAHYRLRSDGLITQALAQFDNPQPRDEDGLWARALYGQALGAN